MVLHELPHLGANLLERLLPADLLESIPNALQWHPQTVGRVVDLVVAKPLDARVPLADDVLGVGLDGDDLVVLDCGAEAAGRLANAAKRKLCSTRHDG